MLRRLLLSKGGTQLKKPVIEFRDFGFKYDAQQRPTLYNIDLTVYEGEKILICGPSGCGKSTLASCINGLIPQRYFGEKTGKLYIGGEDSEKLSIFEPFFNVQMPLLRDSCTARWESAWISRMISGLRMK